jgi:NAD(P)-dependent dehydrogenase (short-subunit alcohol dehydrogenase family)
MEDFSGRVAVITGGASGIGRAIARRLAAEGVKLVLADIEEPVLASTVAELAATGAQVIGVPTDVSVLADVQRLADRTLDEFGAVHIVCNNAGVAGGTVATAPIELWDWVLGVNLYGVIHGCATFLPILLEQDVGHVVNTASIAGLGGVGAFGVYCTSKFAVVGLSESLHHELTALGSAVKVSVLCPGFLDTNIYSSERNMPNAVRAMAPDTAIAAESVDAIKAIVPGPEVAADAVFDALRDERFFVLTHERAASSTTEARLAWMRGGDPPAFDSPDAFVP